MWADATRWPTLLRPAHSDARGRLREGALSTASGLRRRKAAADLWFDGAPGRLLHVLWRLVRRSPMNDARYAALPLHALSSCPTRTARAATRPPCMGAPRRFCSWCQQNVLRLRRRRLGDQRRLLDALAVRAWARSSSSFKAFQLYTGSFADDRLFSYTPSWQRRA